MLIHRTYHHDCNTTTATEITNEHIISKGEDDDSILTTPINDDLSVASGHSQISRDEDCVTIAVSGITSG
jgi:hypothetical protein